MLYKILRFLGIPKFKQKRDTSDNIYWLLRGQLLNTLHRKLWCQLGDQLGDRLVGQLWYQLMDQLRGQLRYQLWDRQLPNQEKLDKAWGKLNEKV